MRCSNLPSQLSTFIGREREVATATRLLHTTRLLTLTGAGGSGKTRLALALAEPLVRRYGDGVWFVDLAEIEDPELAPQAVADALNLRGAPGRSLRDALIAYLRAKHILLILDNCEHMVGACAELAFALLTAAPRLRIVATSREPLRMSGETVWAVPPLALPELAKHPRIEELARVEAVRLFVERANRVMPGFALDEANALPVSQICHWLGGSPLAIELAAARIRVLSPAQITARLSDALGILVTGDRTAPPRQRSLQAALDWSYDLLSGDAQTLFQRLSVFAGSFSLEAAEAVCASDHAGAAPALELLTGLVDKSLLEVEAETGPERRFRYLEPVRQYALVKLQKSGDEAQARDRLLAWAVAFAETVGPGAYLSLAKPNVERLEIEQPNLRAALAWGMTGASNPIERHRLAIALAQFWQVRGYIGEGVSWFEQLLDRLTEAPVPLQIDTLQRAAFLAIHAPNFERARRYLEQGIEMAKLREDRHGLPELYHHLCFLTFNEGDLDAADRLCDETLAMFTEQGDDWGRAITLFYRSNIDHLRGDLARARASAEASAAICREIGYAPALARRQVRLGLILLAEGDMGGATRCITDGLRIAHETGDTWGVAMSLSALAARARHQGHYERAAWLLGATQHLRDTFGVPLWKIDEMEYDRSTAEVRSLLGEPNFQAALERGATQAAADLDRALRTALDQPAQARTAPSAAAAPAPTPGSGGFTPLTRRELEVANLVAQGKSNAEIAATLFVGLRTVEAHVTHILNKLGFNSRSQIAAWIAAQSPTAPHH